VWETDYDSGNMNAPCQWVGPRGSKKREITCKNGVGRHRGRITPLWVYLISLGHSYQVVWFSVAVLCSLGARFTPPTPCLIWMQAQDLTSQLRAPRRRTCGQLKVSGTSYLENNSMLRILKRKTPLISLFRHCYVLVFIVLLVAFPPYILPYVYSNFTLCCFFIVFISLSYSFSVRIFPPPWNESVMWPCNSQWTDMATGLRDSIGV
jgi:hypothetical protein